jgi:uncharacterized protein YlxW (UPF0749 family)
VEAKEGELMNDSLATPEKSPLTTQPSAQRKGMRRDVQLSLTLAFVVLGALVAAQLKTQQVIRKNKDFRSKQEQFAVAAQKELVETKREADKLRTERDSLKVKLDQYQKASEMGSTQAKILATDLQKVKALAGFTPVKGPGVVVTLRDSTQIPKGAPPAETELYLVHDWQVLQVVNELRNAGAEAVAVNGHRLGVNSSVRCVGSVITIDGTRVGGPYKIEAIGDPETLQSGLKLPGGIMQELSQFLPVKVVQQRDIILPAFEGAISLKYAARAELTHHKKGQ